MGLSPLLQFIKEPLEVLNFSLEEFLGFCDSLLL